MLANLFLVYWRLGLQATSCKSWLPVQRVRARQLDGQQMTYGRIKTCNWTSIGWTSLQLIQAFPFDTAPRFIIRDRDSIYGATVVATIRQIGSKQKVIARRSPWQNGYCERMVGTIKRDCLDHMIILNELHLRRVLKDYFKYYHEVRTHLGLHKDAPITRASEPSERGPIRSEPMVRGLHHRYYRQAA